jgi:acyl-CoA hydrolase/GNAT superfamily N-acetyltransferase
VEHDTWQARFAEKITSADQAVRAIPQGRRILIGSGAAEPMVLVEGLVNYGAHLADNEIVHLLTLGPAPYVQRGLERRFRHTAFFIGANVRDAIHDGRADFMPIFLSDVPELIRTRRVRIDVALIEVSPPDRHGFVSLGVSVDIVRTGVDCADLIIAEVNPNMPRTHGDSSLHVSRIAHLVPVNYPLPERISEPMDDTCAEIGRHVASLIPDGATLQLGIGTIPEATLSALRHHQDLGIHTEMFSDGVMELIEAGVITGRKKTLLPGKHVTSFVMGSRKLYEWMHENPAVEMRPTRFTNDPFTIARNDRMVAINAALAVDLTGQVAADTLKGQFFSGIGGQVDFVRGAARSRGGKPIIAMRSTAQKGTVSRIQPLLEEGAGVVTSRGDVHYVVTEFGVADLWGKNIRQRALALIEIAHPDFRADLLDAAKNRRYVFPDQVVPRAAYPWQESRTERLRTGEQVVVRPVRLTDEEALRDLFYRLHDESMMHRFLKYKHEQAREEMLQLVDLDEVQSAASVVCYGEGGHEAIIAASRYDVDPATALADIVMAVRGDWHGKGVGSLLMRRMAEIARSQGINGFAGNVAVTNKAMMAIFYHSQMRLVTELVEGNYKLVAYFPEPGDVVLPTVPARDNR